MGRVALSVRDRWRSGCHLLSEVTRSAWRWSNTCAGLSNVGQETWGFGDLKVAITVGYNQ